MFEPCTDCCGYVRCILFEPAQEADDMQKSMIKRILLLGWRRCSSGINGNTAGHYFPTHRMEISLKTRWLCSIPFSAKAKPASNLGRIFRNRDSVQIRGAFPIGKYNLRLPVCGLRGTWNGAVYAKAMKACTPPPTLVQDAIMMNRGDANNSARKLRRMCIEEEKTNRNKNTVKKVAPRVRYTKRKTCVELFEVLFIICP